jgi:hypothetical protein
VLRAPVDRSLVRRHLVCLAGASLYLNTHFSFIGGGLLRLLFAGTKRAALLDVACVKNERSLG